MVHGICLFKFLSTLSLAAEMTSRTFVSDLVLLVPVEAEPELYFKSFLDVPEGFETLLTALFDRGLVFFYGLPVCSFLGFPQFLVSSPDYLKPPVG